MEDILKMLRRFRWRLGFYRQRFTAAGEFELRLLKYLVAPDAIVADVGANSGIYSFHLKKLSSEVWAFEPNANYHERLLDLGRKVRLEDVALSDSEGEAILSIPLGEAVAAHGWGTIEAYAGKVAETRRVKVRTLDSYRVDFGFIKIDVEGHEMSVLQGAIETLKRARPNLLVECEERHRRGATSELFKLMSDLGYNGYFFRNKRCFAVASFEPKIHQREGLISLGQRIVRQRVDYVNNFVFIPEERSVPQLQSARSRDLQGAGAVSVRVAGNVA